MASRKGSGSMIGVFRASFSSLNDVGRGEKKGERKMGEGRGSLEGKAGRRRESSGQVLDEKKGEKTPELTLDGVVRKTSRGGKKTARPCLSSLPVPPNPPSATSSTSPLALSLTINSSTSMPNSFPSPPVSPSTSPSPSASPSPRSPSPSLPPPSPSSPPSPYSPYSPLVPFDSPRPEATELKKVVRAYLEDDAVLRILGLHNTFKTFEVTEETTVRHITQSMTRKMKQTLSRSQQDLITQTCMHYHFFLVKSEDGRIVDERQMDFGENIWALVDDRQNHLIFRALGIPMRVFLDDNQIWKRMGIHNTFKTLFITQQTQVEEMTKMLLTKVTRGTPHEQTDATDEFCKHAQWAINYRFEENSKTTLLEVDPHDYPLVIFRKIYLKYRSLKSKGTCFDSDHSSFDLPPSMKSLCNQRHESPPPPSNSIRNPSPSFPASNEMDQSPSTRKRSPSSTEKPGLSSSGFLDQMSYTAHPFFSREHSETEKENSATSETSCSMREKRTPSSSPAFSPVATSYSSFHQFIWNAQFVKMIFRVDPSHKPSSGTYLSDEEASPRPMQSMQAKVDPVRNRRAMSPPEGSRRKENLSRSRPDSMNSTLTTVLKPRQEFDVSDIRVSPNFSPSSSSPIASSDRSPSSPSGPKDWDGRIQLSPEREVEESTLDPPLARPTKLYSNSRRATKYPRQFTLEAPRVPSFSGTSEWVTLNVGGKRYETYTSTFQSYPTTMLARMFDPENKQILQKDKKDEYLIDRNGRAFEGVLEFFRTGRVFLPPGVTEEQLAIEFDYFQLPMVPELRNSDYSRQFSEPLHWQEEAVRLFDHVSHAVFDAIRKETIEGANYSLRVALLPRDELAGCQGRLGPIVRGKSRFVKHPSPTGGWCLVIDHAGRYFLDQLKLCFERLGFWITITKFRYCHCEECKKYLNMTRYLTIHWTPPTENHAILDKLTDISNALDTGINVWNCNPTSGSGK